MPSPYLHRPLRTEAEAALAKLVHLLKCPTLAIPSDHAEYFQAARVEAEAILAKATEDRKQLRAANDNQPREA